MYHIELRRFPHNFSRFNLSERELRMLVLDAWAHGQEVEVGERRWNPREATLTVLEGPELPPSELSMGRGWRAAQRRCRDVTAELLAAAGEGSVPSDHLVAKSGSFSSGHTVIEDGPVPSGHAAAGVGGTDALAAQISALLGEDAEPLLRAWQVALERHPNRPPSECLALAEDLVRR